MKEKGFAGQWVKMRQEALERFIAEAEEGSAAKKFLKKSECPCFLEPPVSFWVFGLDS